jgi:hypothetical protein
VLAAAEGLHVAVAGFHTAAAEFLVAFSLLLGPTLLVGVPLHCLHQVNLLLVNAALVRRYWDCWTTKFLLVVVSKEEGADWDGCCCGNHGRE